MSTAAVKEEGPVVHADLNDPCADSRCRLVVLASVRHALKVPRHIVRAGGDTPGWQVRFNLPTRFFADGRFDGPLGSLEAAKSFLRTIYRPIKKRTHLGARRKESPFPGHDLAAGVTYRVVNNKSCPPTLFLVAAHPRRTVANVKFKVGSVGRYEDHHIQRAVQLANAKRREWEQALEQHGMPVR